MIINPYLHFAGNAAEAFAFYKQVFGNEFSMMQRYSDIPAEIPTDKADADLVLHVALPIGKQTILMGGDVPASMPGSVIGTNFSVSVHVDSREEADRIFKALTTGGSISMPLDDTFWGSYFGMLTDPFGIQWMVSYDAKPSIQG